MLDAAPDLIIYSCNESSSYEMQPPVVPDAGQIGNVISVFGAINLFVFKQLKMISNGLSFLY